MLFKPGEFENATLFLQLSLPFTLICHGNGAFRKRSSNWRNLRFSGHDTNDSTMITWFPWPSFPQIQVQHGRWLLRFKISPVWRVRGQKLAKSWRLNSIPQGQSSVPPPPRDYLFHHYQNHHCLLPTDQASSSEIWTARRHNYVLLTFTNTLP